jgi:anti-sigma-K factor RskA
MNCPVQTNQSTELLIDYCAGTLPLGVASEVERHVAICAECEKFVQAQQQVWSALDTWETDPISADFDRRLYDRIRQTERSSWRNWFAGHFAWRPALSLGAACAAVVVALVVNSAANKPIPNKTTPPAVHQASAQPASAPHEEVRADSVEPEQLERALEDLEMLKQLSTPAAHNL